MRRWTRYGRFGCADYSMRCRLEPVFLRINADGSQPSLGGGAHSAKAISPRLAANSFCMRALPRGRGSVTLRDAFRSRARRQAVFDGRLSFGGKHAVDNFPEFLRTNQASLLNAFLFYTTQHLRDGAIVRVTDPHLFEMICDRRLAAFLSEYHFAAASGQRRMSSEHRQRFFDHQIDADARLAREIPFAENRFVNRETLLAQTADQLAQF